MKRYLIFAGDDYYPAGGWSDFKKDFDTIKSAEEYIKNKLTKTEVTDTVTYHFGNEFTMEPAQDGKLRKYTWNTFEWLHIIDTNTGKLVRKKKGKGFFDCKPQIVKK